MGLGIDTDISIYYVDIDITYLSFFWTDISAFAETGYIELDIDYSPRVVPYVGRYPDRRSKQAGWGVGKENGRAVCLTRYMTYTALHRQHNELSESSRYSLLQTNSNLTLVYRSNFRLCSTVLARRLREIKSKSALFCLGGAPKAGPPQ